MADDDRQELHELREKGHEAGIEGSSKMTEDQLREALREREHGASPEDAKATAKDEHPS